MKARLWSREFCAITSSTFLMAWAFYALLPTLPIYLMKDLMMDQRHAGIVIASFSISAILIRPFSGLLLDNYRRGPVLISSLALLAVGYGVYLVANSFAAMFALRLFHGAMWGVCTSANATVLADTVPPSRLGEGIGIFALTIPIGMTAGPAFGLEILHRCGAPTMFLSVLGVSIVATVLASFVRTSHIVLTRRGFSLGNLFHPKALWLSLCMFFIMIAYGAIVIFVGVYAAQRNFSNAAVFFLFFSAAVFMSRLFLGRLFDRGYFSGLVSAGLALSAGGVFFIGFAANAWQFLAAGMAAGLGFGILMPACQAAVNALVDLSGRGAANSTYFISYDLGVGTSAVMIGFLADRVPLGTMYGYCAVLILISASIFFLAAMPHYRRNKGSGGR